MYHELVKWKHVSTDIYDYDISILNGCQKGG